MLAINYKRSHDRNQSIHIHDMLTTNLTRAADITPRKKGIKAYTD